MLARWIGARERSRWESLVTALLVAASVGVLLYRVREMTIPVVDDAAISIAYGRTFWTGHGMRITPYSQITEAFSNPLWTLIVGLPAALGFDPLVSAQNLGITTAVLALPLVVLWGPTAGARPLRIEDAMPAVIACSTSSYIYWAGAGLEGPLVTLVVGATGLAALWEMRTGRARFTGIGLGLLTLVRPEGAIYAAAIALPILLVRRRVGRSELTTAGVALGIAGGGVAIRYATFASALPNPFYVKHLLFRQHEQYLGSFAEANVALIGLLGLAIVLAPFVLRGTISRLVVSMAIALIGAAIALIVDAGGDWMREWRFLAPMVPIACVVPATVFSAMRARVLVRPRIASEKQSLRFRGAALALVVLAGAHVSQTRQELERLPDIQHTPTFPAHLTMDFWRPVFARLDSLGLRHPRVGMADIGGPCLAWPQTQLVDVAGLADWTIARALRHDLPSVEDYLVHEVPPTLIDIHGPSGLLSRASFFNELYEPIEAYVPTLRNFTWVRTIRGLTRDEDPRCPGGLAVVRAMDRDALADAIDEQIEHHEPETALRLYRCAREHGSDRVMPTADRMAASSARSIALRDEQAESEIEIELALRYSSLATVLAGDDPHLRRQTEVLRARFIPQSNVDWLIHDRDE